MWITYLSYDNETTFLIELAKKISFQRLTYPTPCDSKMAFLNDLVICELKAMGMSSVFRENKMILLNVLPKNELKAKETISRYLDNIIDF